MNYITSRTNETIKRIASLANSRERAHYQLFLAEGLRVCTTLCTSGMRLNHLYITEQMTAHAQQLAPDAVITVVSPHVMEKISQATTPSGIVGVFHIPPSPTTLQGPGIVLAQVREPGNVGTLIRSCAAFGMRTVIIVDSADVWSHKVVQASAGTLGSVDIFVMSWNELIERKGSYRLCALIVSGGNAPHALDCTNSLLVVGNEAHGIPDAWIRDCEQKLTLPMPGNTESLNAAVAGSLGLYVIRKT